MFKWEIKNIKDQVNWVSIPFLRRLTSPWSWFLQCTQKFFNKLGQHFSMACPSCQPWSPSLKRCPANIHWKKENDNVWVHLFLVLWGGASLSSLTSRLREVLVRIPHLVFQVLAQWSDSDLPEPCGTATQRRRHLSHLLEVGNEAHWTNPSHPTPSPPPLTEGLLMRSWSDLREGPPVTLQQLFWFFFSPHSSEKWPLDSEPAVVWVCPQAGRAGRRGTIM